MRHRYLRPFWDLPEVYLYRQPIDFRKQTNGLSLIVEQELGHSPFSAAAMVSVISNLQEQLTSKDDLLQNHQYQLKQLDQAIQSWTPASRFLKNSCVTRRAAFAASAANAALRHAVALAH